MRVAWPVLPVAQDLRGPRELPGQPDMLALALVALSSASEAEEPPEVLERPARVATPVVAESPGLPDGRADLARALAALPVVEELAALAPVVEVPAAEELVVVEPAAEELVVVEPAVVEPAVVELAAWQAAAAKEVPRCVIP